MMVQELFAALGLDVDLTGFAKAAGALGLLKAGMDTVADLAKQVGHEIINMVGDTAQGAVQIARTAQKLGITTDAFQELSFAAKASGVDVESFQTGLRFLEKNAYDAAHGSGELAQKFRELGLDARGLSKQSPDEMLLRVAGALERVQDPGKRASLAMHLLGRGGVELLPLLSKGREGIEELGQEAHRFGVVLGKDAIQRSFEYVKVNRELKEALEGMKLAIIGPLIQASKMKLALVEWILAHRQLIAQGAHRFFDVLKMALRGVVNALGAIVNAFRFLIETWAGRFLGIAAAVVAAFTLITAESLAAAGSILAGWAAAAAPFVLWGLAIGALILLLDELWVTLQGGDSILNRHARAIIDFFDSWLGPLADVEKTLARISGWFDELEKKGYIAKSIVGFVTGRSANKAQADLDRIAADYKSSYFGGGAASPAAAAAAAPAGGVKVVAPQINQTVNAAPGQSEEKIADISRQLFEDVLNSHYRPAAAAGMP